MVLFEYLDKNEDAFLPRGCCHQDRNDFTFDGHRLSSLYRDTNLIQIVLNCSKRTRVSASFLFKYSNSTSATHARGGAISA